LGRSTAGGYHTCGIKGDGKLFCWGEKSSIGSQNDITAPTQIDSDSWSAISTGYRYSCGIKEADRRLYCWGTNTAAQLGDGTTIDKNNPTPVGKDKWYFISTGYNHTCGIKLPDHKLYCWGSNHSGQLGDGNAWVPPKPVPILFWN
jgi:hypothetical protein